MLFSLEAAAAAQSDLPPRAAPLAGEFAALLPPKADATLSDALADAEAAVAAAAWASATASDGIFEVSGATTGEV